MKQVQFVPKKKLLTSALLLALASPAWSQESAQNEGECAGHATAG